MIVLESCETCPAHDRLLEPLDSAIASGTIMFSTSEREGCRSLKLFLSVNVLRI